MTLIDRPSRSAVRRRLPMIIGGVAGAGALVCAIALLLHGAWDFAQFAQPMAPLFDAPSSLVLFVGVFAVVAAWRMTAPGRDDVFVGPQ